MSHICSKCSVELNDTNWHPFAQRKNFYRCKACVCKAKREYNVKHRDKISQWEKNDREKNKDKYIERAKRYYEKNKDEINAKAKQWKLDHPEEHAKKRKEHAKKRKEYYAKNKDKLNEYGREYYSKFAGISAEERKMVESTIDVKEMWNNLVREYK